MTDTNPPLGATVVDGDGLEYECVGHVEKWAKWCIASNRIEAEAGIADALTALWRLQQERDQLQAENAALRADKERLDWLAEHGYVMGSSIEMDHNSRLDGRDLRAAIDAARGDA